MQTEQGISGYDSIESFKASLETHVPPTTNNPVNDNILFILSGMMDIIQDYRMEAKKMRNFRLVENIKWRLSKLGFVIEEVKDGMIKWTLK